MADAELEALRAQKLAQLQNQQQQGGGGGGPNAGENEAAEERRNQADQMKNQILSQILDQQARARLNTIMIAKPEKGHAVENLLVNMARSGQLRQKLGETELIGLLEQVSERTQKTTSVKFDRRRCNFDDDDDELEYDL